VQVVSAVNQAMQELATGDWTLVIANVAMTGLSGPLYTTLKALALAPVMESGAARLRVLFLVPETAGAEAQAALEGEKLPYETRPFNLHDFLEKVSDLLMETASIQSPIRRVRQEGPDFSRRGRRGRQPASDGGRATGMFASREDYSMTEEEIAEYEKQEAEIEKKKKKKLNPNA
jgi:hypothetical protein